jgi:hypothetical protein
MWQRRYIGGAYAPTQSAGRSARPRFPRSCSPPPGYFGLGGRDPDNSMRHIETDHVAIRPPDYVPACPIISWSRTCEEDVVPGEQVPYLLRILDLGVMRWAGHHHHPTLPGETKPRTAGEKGGKPTAITARPDAALAGPARLLPDGPGPSGRPPASRRGLPLERTRSPILAPWPPTPLR